MEKQASDKWVVIQPSWRPDLTREADLVEEVGRVYGLDEIPPKLPCVERSLDSLSHASPIYAFWQKIKEWGAGIGLNEVVNYSFTGSADLEILNLPDDEWIRIYNPLSEDQNVLRTRITPGLLTTLAWNLAHGIQTLHIFELANVFLADKRSETTASEKGTLGVLLYGLEHEPGWPWPDRDMGYGDIKGLAENLFQLLHLGGLDYTLQESHPYFTPCVAIKSGSETVGVIGRIAPKIAKHYHAQKDVWIAELDLHILHKLYVRTVIAFKPIPAFPAVKRDITVSAKNDITAEALLKHILAMNLPLLEGAVLLDCYEPEDKAVRNLTFRLTFRHATRTLKDTEADKERNKIADALRKDMGVEIPGL